MCHIEYFIQRCGSTPYSYRASRNVLLQDAVVSYITHHDRDNKFLLHLEHRMRASALAIELRKERTFSGFENMSDEAREAYQNAAQTFLAMKVLCEGHNEEAQNILRAQPASTDINTVATAANLVSLLCDTSNSLRAMEDAEVELVVSGLDCLIELVQGPCVGNQELLANLDGFIPALDRVHNLYVVFDVNQCHMECKIC